MTDKTIPLIYEKSASGRCAHGQMPEQLDLPTQIPSELKRRERPRLPEVSEMQTVRHYTKLSQRNFSIDTEFYPLGSCTMKYNPRGVNKLAMQPGFLARHPLTQPQNSQGIMKCLYELQEVLKEVMGMQAVSLTPMAGSQGELAGCAMIKAYHEERGDIERVEMIVPDAAHGTNPASAKMCGFTVREVPTLDDGNIDVEALKLAVGPQTAGIMLTNPTTGGVFEVGIEAVSKIVHEAGGLLYYDGANLNAILGKVRPGDMGFDVMHMNLHKTFATPHGGGGPGAGPVAVGERLKPYLPTPMVTKRGDQYEWLTEKDCPKSIGRLSTFMGNAAILLRAYIYARMLGREGLHRVADFAVLAANYVSARLKSAGFTLAYPERMASHEFIITFASEHREYDISAMDLAKRLLDFDIHPPTTYFPLIIPECWLIEPTETESIEELDRFIDAMITIMKEVAEDAGVCKSAPHTLPVRRIDDVRAARELDLKAE